MPISRRETEREDKLYLNSCMNSFIVIDKVNWIWFHKQMCNVFLLEMIDSARQTIPGLLILGGTQGNKVDGSKDSLPSNNSQTKVNSLDIISFTGYFSIKSPFVGLSDLLPVIIVVI